jgi:hypothetical protein
MKPRAPTRPTRVRTSNALRRAHLGARLADEDGVVEWSQATNTKALE